MRRTLAVFLGSILQVCAVEPSGGNAKIYLGGRPGQIEIFDEKTETKTGEIKLKIGSPQTMELSYDRKLFYVMNQNLEDVEVVDIASQKVTDTFHLSEGNKKVRIRGFEPDPSNSTAILLTKAASKLSDHFEIGPNIIQQYDLKEHKIIRTIPWPKGEEHEFASFKFSPDGKYLYMFGDDILVFDTKEFKQVDQWELSRPIEDGLGRIGFNSLDDFYEEPGFFTGTFQMQDPVQNRRIMGIARVNLGQKSVDFFALGPAVPLRFALAPGRKNGYAIMSEIGRYEFWSFDLEHRQIDKRQEFQGRPRMAIKTSSNGKLLYIYQAGSTIDIYDASTFKYLRTMSLDMDMSTPLYVLN
ncbi:MAG: hypothetical protein JO022_19365 [Acidobacteriaceae bacterium]|nr:hypothetical protein [Acidobacteriaceae bacterium]